MMRRAKKITKKPDSQEESPNGLNSGENRTQPKKVKAKKSTNMPKPVENEDTKDVPTVVAKKGRANVKEKPSKPVVMDEESEEPKKITKKAKGKKPVKSNEPMEGAEGESSEKETTEKPKQAPKKLKALGKKSVKSVKSDEHDEKASGESSNKETEKPKQIPKKLRTLGKKLVKPVKLDEQDEESSGESSDNDSAEKPKQAPKKLKALGKKSVKSVKLGKHDDEASGESSDEETTEKPKQTPKKLKALGKKPVKSVKHDEEASEESSDEESTEKPKQTAKKVKVLGKKSIKSVKVDKHDAEASRESSDIGSEQREKFIDPEKELVKSEPVDSITFEFVEESPQDSSGNQQSKAVINEKSKKVLKQPDAAESSDESEVERTPIKRVITTRAQEAPAQDTSNKPVSKPPQVTKAKPKNQDDLSDGEISSDSEMKHDMDQYKDCKHAMRVLRSIDPDFHKFLMMHDSELLNLDDHEKVLDEEEDDEEPEQIHVPGDKLHVDSDESDFEDDEAEPVQGKVTHQMISNLNNELIKTSGKMKLSTIILATKLFNGAVKRATSDDGNTEGEFKVTGSGIFNNIINMCVLYLPNGIKRYLGTDHSEKDPSKCKHFVKIKATLVQYLNDLMKLLTVVTSDNILVVMLKHLHQMAPYVACFVRIAKKAIKTILPLWSSGEETVRVLAFVCILRITRSQRSEFLGIVLKAMYMTYVKNSKFVSPTTWPGINFMRRSLVEMFLLNVDVSYPIAFVYIRQLGIHLRNALMVPKKENIQALYNWQYLNSFHLWAQLIPLTMHLAHTITTLLFPLTMIISNIIKMKPTIQYYPVRFRMVEILTQMTRESGKFIPVHGYLMEVLRKFDFNKKSQKVSMKPMDLSCIIRLNKSQLSENSLKDAVAERVYALLLDYESHISSDLSFPDAAMILIIHLETVIRKSTCPNFKSKFQQLHDKIEENSKFIHNIRYTNEMSLRDGDVVRAEQKRIKAAGTPLMAFFEKWKKVNVIQKRKAVTKNDQLAGEMPTIKRTKITEEAKGLFKDDTENPVTLFPSDSEDETDGFKTLVEKKDPQKDQNGAKQKMKKKKNNKEKVGKNEIKIPDAADDAEEAEDIVQEFSAGDW